LVVNANPPESIRRVFSYLDDANQAKRALGGRLTISYRFAISAMLLSSAMASGGAAISARSSGLRHSFNQRLTDTVIAMGILNTVGEIAGAVAAVDAAEKVDPDAGLLTKGIAAVAGFEGAKKLEELAEKKDDAGDAQAPDADSDSGASQA
jgi:hypothetical protein